MTFQRLTTFAIAAVSVTILAGAAISAPVTVTTARGPVVVDMGPKTVIAYDVAAIDTLTALGIPVAGVPDNLYVGYLGDVSAKAQKVGTLFEPDLEAVANMAPDLIIVGGRSAAQFDSLERVAPVLDMSISPDVLGDAEKRITDYGALFGKADKATALNAELDAKVASLRKAAEGQGRAMIVLTNGPKVAAYGAGSRFGWLHTVTGMPEAKPGLSTQNHGDAVSFEFIAEANPDWMFVIDRGTALGEGGQSSRVTLDNPLVKTTNAAKNGHIVYLDGSGMYIAGGGYTALNDTIDLILAALKK